MLCGLAACGRPSAPNTPPDSAALPTGNASIRGRFGPSDIVISTTDRLAGAIDSLTWNGMEFIDSADHGRQLQSASSFDAGAGGEFWAECFNPTEAGSRADGAGPRSSSRLLRLQADGRELRATTRMAFWLAPGELSAERPALNRAVLSDHTLSKRVRIGAAGLPNVIDYEVTFSVPAGEGYTLAQFEALTGYMPPEFSCFYTLTRAASDAVVLKRLSDGPGEQEHPVVFATPSGSHAMGVICPDPTPPGIEGPGYGRFRFEAEKVVKWNCVFRRRSLEGVAAGDYRFRMLVAVGTLEDVRQALGALAAP